MGWLRHSAREKFIDDIPFGKRGQILGGGGAPTTGGAGGHSIGGGQSSGGRILLIGLFLMGLLVVGVIGWGYVNSPNGQRAIQSISATIQQWNAQYVSGFFSRLESTGSGNYFSSTINSSSTKKGIDLVSFTSLTGDTIPAGQAFDLMYNIKYYNVPSSSTYTADFSCYFNTSKKDASSNERRDGQILPENPTTIQKGTTTTCRISADQTADLKDSAYTIFGSFTFPMETKDATLPVYFIPGNVADQLGDKDFFTVYDLGISQSDLRVVYNGEPISIGIGVGGEGQEQQPVIVRSGDTLSYNTVAITLTNEWNGDIASLDGLTLSLPDGVTLNDALNGAPSMGCPFVAAGTGNRQNMYIMDDSVKENLFQNYFSPSSFLGHGSFFGKVDYHTFQCWISVDPSIFGDAPYVVKDYKVDVQYHYTVQKQQDTVSIIQQGESLVS